MTAAVAEMAVAITDFMYKTNKTDKRLSFENSITKSVNLLQQLDNYRNCLSGVAREVKAGINRELIRSRYWIAHHLPRLSWSFY